MTLGKQLAREFYSDYYDIDDAVLKTLNITPSNNLVVLVKGKKGYEGHEITALPANAYHWRGRLTHLHTDQISKIQTREFPPFVTYRIANIAEQLNNKDIKPKDTINSIPETNEMWKRLIKVQANSKKLYARAEETLENVEKILESVRTTKQLSDLTDAFEEFYPADGVSKLPIPMEAIKKLKPIETVA